MKLSSNRGTVLVVAVIFAMIMALGALSFVHTSLQTLSQANRSFHYNSAINVAEAGAEEAIWALNNSDWTATSGWTGTGDRTLLGSFADPHFKDSNGISSYFNVFVKDANGTTPTITAEAVIRPAKGALIRKQIRLYAKNGNVFLPPFTAITSMKLNGGEIDSYDMTKGHYTAAPREFDTTVASPTITIGDIAIGSPANIYGHVSVGISHEDSAAFINTIKGELIGEDTQVSDPAVIKSGSNIVDTSLISYDFTQDFPPVKVPDTSAAVSSLPSPDAQGYIVIGNPAATATDAPTVYDLTSVSVKTGETLLVVGPVQLVVAGDTSVAGQGAVVVLDGTHVVTPKKGPAIAYTGSDYASAEIYARGNISISGNGTAVGLDVQAEDPARLKIYGTAPLSQTISIGGNGNLGAAVYAPKAAIVFNGGGSSGYFAGAVVGNTITVNGNGYRVRFPEQLADVSTLTTYQIARWVELTDRSDWHTF